jgi:Uma2 family endonuclease
MNITVEKILERPDAKLLMDKVNYFLSAEYQKRMAFREWLDEDKKAEFINGEIFMHSPVKRKHWKASTLLSRILGVYSSLNDLGEIAVEKALIALTRNDYEPDICFWLKEKANNFFDDQMIFPAPDFVVEILSRITAKNDRTIKHQDYAAHGIKEYWIIDPNRQSIDQFILIGNDTEYMPAKTHLISQDIKSFVIEGFNIPVVAIFDEQANKAALQHLIQKKSA